MKQADDSKAAVVMGAIQTALIAMAWNTMCILAISGMAQAGLLNLSEGSRSVNKMAFFASILAGVSMIAAATTAFIIIRRWFNEMEAIEGSLGKLAAYFNNFIPMALAGMMVFMPFFIAAVLADKG